MGNYQWDWRQWRLVKKNRKVDKKEQQVEMETDSTKREGIKSEGGHPQNSPKTGLDTTLFHISMNDLGEEAHANRVCR